MFPSTTSGSDCLQEGKLTASEGLGDLFKGVNDWDTALDVYRQAGAANKVVEALAAKGDFEQLATFTRSSGGYLNLLLMLSWHRRLFVLFMEQVREALEGQGHSSCSRVAGWRGVVKWVHRRSWFGVSGAQGQGGTRFAGAHTVLHLEIVRSPAQ